VKKGTTRDSDRHGSAVADYDIVWSREGAGGRESTIVKGHMTQPPLTVKLFRAATSPEVSPYWESVFSEAEADWNTSVVVVVRAS
jgi:hypothetical protein